MKLKKAFNNLPFEIEIKITEVSERQLNNVKRNSNPFVVSDISFKFRKMVIDNGYIIKELIALYYSGWGGDQWAAICVKNGKTFKVTTNHGFIEVKNYDEN